MAGPALLEEYVVHRCGAKFTNNDEGKRLYDLHQSSSRKQSSMRRELEQDRKQSASSFPSAPVSSSQPTRGPSLN